MTRLALLGIVLASLAGAACLQKDTSSTIYLRQDGSLDWIVVDRNVRSDATEDATRAHEEAEYMDAVVRDEHGVAVAFRVLGATSVRTEVHRATRPYSVSVEGTFDSLASMVAQPLAACSVPYDTAITRTNGVTTWTLKADLAHNDGQLSPEGCDKAFEGLVDALGVVIVLESGRFTNAVGFTVQHEDRAVFDEHATDREVLDRTDGWLQLSLSWTGFDRKR